jgi:hypothetical protein
VADPGLRRLRRHAGRGPRFETFGKLAPCLLCLKQREVYWVAGTGGPDRSRRLPHAWADQGARPLDLLLAAIFLYGAGLAAFHAGVEWKWWPGPTTCTGGGAASAGDLVAMLKGGASQGPAVRQGRLGLPGPVDGRLERLISLGLAIASLTALRPAQGAR